MARRQKWLLLILLLVGVFASYRAYQFYTALQTERERPAITGLKERIKTGIPNKRFASPIVSVPPHKMREYLQDAYRLKPDVRMANAIADIHHFLTGEPKDEVKSEFAQGKWLLTYKGSQVGTVPELPDFSDWLAILKAWAVEVNKKSPLNFAQKDRHLEIEAKIKDLSAPTLFQALEQINTRWNQETRNPEFMRLASQALALLSFLNLDELESATPLFSRTMATIAMTEAFTKENVRAEECLFAQELGYSKSAYRCGESLPLDDPVRLYVTLDDKRLKLMARSNNLGRAFWIARMAKDKDEKAWREFSSSPAAHLPSSTQLMKGAVKIEREYTEPFIPLSYAVFSQLSEVDPDVTSLSRMPVSKLIEEFEKELKKRGNIQQGPFLDSDLKMTYYRSFFYSGLFLQARHYLSHPYEHDIQTMEALLQQLSSNQTEVGGDFQRWFADILNFKKGGPANLTKVVDDLTAFPHLGATTFQTTYDELANYLAYSDLRLFHPAVQLVKRMDTRPSHRYYLAVIATRNLVDPKLADRLYNSFAGVVSPCEYETLTHYANLAADENFVKGLLHMDKCSVECRASIFWRLIHQEPIDHQLVSEEFEKFIQEFPHSWRAREFYIDYLRGKGDYDHAIKVIESWLAKNSKGDFFGDGVFHAHLRLSHTYYLAQRYDDAWKALQPIVMLDRRDVNAEKALILGRRGQVADAEKLLRQIIAKTPNDPDFRLDLMEVLWVNGKYSEAANVIRDAPRTNQATWCYQVSNRLANAFWKQPVEKEAKAGKALLQAKLNMGPAGCMMQEMMRSGNYERALRWHSMMDSLSLTQPKDDVIAYYCIRAQKGNGTATEWLKKRYPVEKRLAFIHSSFEYEDPDLLWNFLPDPDTSEAGIWMWINRAIATFKSPPADPSQIKRLEAFFKNAGNAYPKIIGSYLIGHLTDEALLTHATSGGRRAEIAYFIGFKAQVEGRYSDAADWYRVSVQTLDSGNRYFRLAEATLSDWNMKNISFSRIVKEMQAIKVVDATGK